MEYHSFYGIPLVNCISLSGLRIFLWVYQAGRGALYLSISTIGTNEISFIPLVIHWCIAYHYGDLDYFLGASGWEGVHSTRPLVRLVRMQYHSFHWYSIGGMHIIMGCYNISVGVSGWKGVHSTRPLVRLVRMEYHSFHWYSIVEIRTKNKN